MRARKGGRHPGLALHAHTRCRAAVEPTPSIVSASECMSLLAGYFAAVSGLFRRRCQCSM
jgi:hypothetical protein